MSHPAPPYEAAPPAANVHVNLDAAPVLGASGPAANPADSSAKRDNTTPSCAVCQRRKVKCNRVFPCAPCIKTGLECYYKPATTRHRAKRVKRDLDDEGDTPPSDSLPHAAPGAHRPSVSSAIAPARRLPSPGPSSTSSRLVPESTGYRYVNNHLWSGLPSYTPRATDAGASPTLTHTDRSTPATHESTPLPHRNKSTDTTADGRSFVFSPANDSNKSLDQVTPNQIVQLWQVYISNVDPIMKVLHHPTVQQLVLGQIGRGPLPPNEQALVSAIYLCSIVSLTDEECQTILQEPRDEVLVKLRAETEAALSAASFITTTDILVLQAMVLYLAALKSRGEAQAVWSLNGLAIRIAGTMGMARDGSTLNLPPFETEIRRRLWWTMVHLDARMSEMVGQDADLIVQKHDVKVPSNVNDSDLWPSMTRYPEDRAAATELVYVNFRSTLSAFLTSLPGIRGPGTTWKRLAAEGTPKEQKLEVVQSLEDRLRNDIVQYCDRGVPLQLYTMNSIDTVMSKMRLVAHLPDTYVGSDRNGSGRYSEQVFELSMRIMQLQLEIFLEPCLQRFRWHSRGQFQWAGLAYLIRQTRLRGPGPATTKAWTILHRVLNDIMPTIEFGPGKVQDMRLIESIRYLLNSASHEQANNAAKQSTATTSVNGEQAPATPQSNSGSRVPDRFAYGGAAPHSALLPGMLPPSGENHKPPDERSVGNGEPMIGGPEKMVTLDDMLDFDLGAINWEEFDRLTAELMD